MVRGRHSHGNSWAHLDDELCALRLLDLNPAEHRRDGYGGGALDGVRVRVRVRVGVRIELGIGLDWS